MSDREALVTKLDALNAELDAGVVRITKGDRTAQYDVAVKERQRDRVVEEIARMDRLVAGPMVRQIRVFGTRGY